MNVLCFTGNLGGDAETRHTTGGAAVTTFSVALSAGFGDKKTTTWLRCNLWGERGEKLAQYLKKGQLVAIVGEFSAREWEDKNGVTKTSCEVRVDNVTLCGKRDGEAKPADREAAQAPAGGMEDFEDSIPFAQHEKGLLA